MVPNNADWAGFHRLKQMPRNAHQLQAISAKIRIEKFVSHKTSCQKF